MATLADTLADIERAMQALKPAQGRMEGLQNLPALECLAALQRRITALCEIPEVREFHRRFERVRNLLNTSIPPELIEMMRRVAEPLPVAPMPGARPSRSYDLSSSLADESLAPTPSHTQDRRLGIQHAYARKLGQGQ